MHIPRDLMPYDKLVSPCHLNTSVYSALADHLNMYTVFMAPLTEHLCVTEPRSSYRLLTWKLNVFCGI